MTDIPDLTYHYDPAANDAYDRMLEKLHALQPGDKIRFTDLDGRTWLWEIGERIPPDNDDLRMFLIEAPE